MGLPTGLRAVVLAAAMLLPFAATAAGQSVRGILSEAETEVPIELATVDAIARSGEVVSSALTDVNGFFDLVLPGDGEYVVRATAFGYQTGRSEVIHIVDDGAQIVYVNLRPAPVEIEGLAVEARGDELSGGRASLTEQGFYERVLEGRGQFLLPGQIAASDAMFTAQLFDGMDHVLPNYSAAVWERSVRFIAATARGNCTPRIFVDGLRIGMLLGGGNYLSDIVPIDEVLAVEVFWGPFQAPLKYQGTTLDNSCGVVLLWTHRRTRP
jgi:hypothetical protein